MNRRILNSRGMTIIEAIISIGLLATVGAGVFIGSSVLTKVSTDSTRITDEAKMIQIFVENLKANTSANQIDFGTDEDAFLDMEKLPIGYGPHFLGPKNGADGKSGCNTTRGGKVSIGCDSPCSGFLGYRISPLSANTPGLFVVKIRIYDFKKAMSCEKNQNAQDPQNAQDVKDLKKDIQFIMQSK